MKKTIIFFSAIIMIGALTSFIFMSKTGNTILNNSNPTTVTPPDSGKTYFDLEISDLKKPKMVGNLVYMVRGYTNQGYLRPITRKELIEANAVSDVLEHYPHSWIEAYNSVTVLGSIDGKEIEIVNSNETLTKKQKEIFKTAPEVFISVQYKKKNEEGQVQNRTMNVSLVVTPEIKAKFIGGHDKLISYLKDNSWQKIQSKNFAYLPQPSISFIINEDGNIENITLKKSSKDDEIDTLLIELIKDMPKWMPAKNAAGLNVKQKFVLDIGLGC